MRFAVTGATGLLGWHAAGRIHADILRERLRGRPDAVSLVRIGRECFRDRDALSRELRGVDTVLHFAGAIRGSSDNLEQVNPSIAERLVDACHSAKVPHLVYANSMHSGQDTEYGRSKREAAKVFSQSSILHCELVLPHTFGENARPLYSNVVTTLVSKICAGQEPWVDPEGSVELIHASTAASHAIEAGSTAAEGRKRIHGLKLTVPELFAYLSRIYRHSDEALKGQPDCEVKLALNNMVLVGSCKAGSPTCMGPEPTSGSLEMRHAIRVLADIYAEIGRKRGYEDLPAPTSLGFRPDLIVIAILEIFGVPSRPVSHDLWHHVGRLLTVLAEAGAQAPVRQAAQLPDGIEQLKNLLLSLPELQDALSSDGVHGLAEQRIVN